MAIKFNLIASISEIKYLYVVSPSGVYVDSFYHTVQRLMLSKGAKKKPKNFYHNTVILQYCWDKTIARSGDMYRDDSGILILVIIR